MKRYLLIFATIFLCACANKSMTRYEALAPAYEKHGFSGAIQTIKKEQADLYGENTKFLYHLDLGILHHYNKDFDASIKELTAAAQVYDDLYARSVTNEAAAIATNDNVRPYRARPFELLLLYEIQVLNFLAKGDIGGAAVEVRRGQLAMEQLYQKDNKKVNDNGFLRYLGALVYELADESDDAAIAYYKTVKAYDESKHPLPKEVWGFVCDRLVANDRADDLKSFEHTPLVFPKAQESREKKQEIIVVAYGGHSPILGELYMSGTFVNGGGLNLNYKDPQTGKTANFTMIAPIMPNADQGMSFHVGFSLPEKKVLKSRVNGFNVRLGSKQEKLESMLDTDLELSQNLDDDRNVTIGRTALRVALRTFAAQKAKQAMQTENALLNLVTNLGTDIAQSQLEQADLRIGLFYPHNIYMTRLPVDAGNHSVEVSALNKNGSIVKSFSFNNIQVKSGETKFLFVPAIE